jgi:hypothetical protein
MNAICKLAIIVTLIGLIGLANQGLMRAEEAPALRTPRPQADLQATGSGQSFLLGTAGGRNGAAAGCAEASRASQGGRDNCR